MGKSFEFKECERFLKRVLKDKGMYSKGAVIAFLITGGIGFVAPVLLGDSVYAATYKWVKIQTETGRTFGDGEQDGETNSVILAPTSGNDLTVSSNYKISPGIFNRRAMNSVIIGYGAYGNALSTETTPGSFTTIGALAHSYGAQGTAVGSGTIAGIQATAIGNDVYATGDSSIAIGNDDIATKYRDQLSLETMKSVYGEGPGKGLFESKEFKSSYSNGENKKNLSVLDWNRFSSSYLTGDKLIYNPTISRGIGSIAIGSRSIAAKDGSTAIGTLAYAFAEGSTAMGLRAFTSADAIGAVAIGEQSRSFARGSLAVGNRNESTNLGSMSYGYNAKAVGEGSLAFGYNVLANAAITNTIAGAGDTKPPTNVYRKALMDNTQGLTYEQLKYIRLYDASLKEYAEVLNKPITDTYREADKKREVEHYRLNVVDSKKEYDKVIKAFTNSGANAAGKNGRNLEDVNNLDLVNKADTTDKSGNTVTAVSAAISDIIGKTTNTTDSTLNVSLEKDTNAGKYLTTTDKNADGTESRKEIYKLKANGKNAIAIGYYTAATGDSSIAQGAGTIVESSSGIGIGSLSYVSDEAKNGIAVGVGSQVRNANSIAIGTQAAVYGARGISMGPGARVIGDESMALGYGSFVKTKDSTALGVGTTIEYGANESMALGTKAYVGTGNIATLSIGNSARVEENSVNSVSIGASSKIGKQSSNSVVLGTSSTIGDLAANSVVIGSHASISDNSTNSMVLGAKAKIINSAKSSIALGEGSVVSGSSSLAFGRQSLVAGDSSIAIGRNAKTSTDSSVALGRGATADFNNSVALGYRSTTFYYGDESTRQAGTSTTVSGNYKHGLDIAPYLPDNAGKGIKEKLAYLNTAAAGYISVGGWDVTKNEDGSANASGAGATLRGLRRIVNVAPGALDTDAVTVAQLREWTDKSAHFLSLAGADEKTSASFTNETAPDGTTVVKSNFDNNGASGEYALALGVYAMGAGAGSISIGRSSFGQGTNSTTLGSYGWGRGTEATSIGYRAYSYGEQSVAIGTRTVTDSDYGVAIGNRARSWSAGDNGHSGIAIGSKATANYWNALALGTESKVRGWHSTAIGANAQVGMPEVFDDNGVSMNVFKADGKSYNKANQAIYEKVSETNETYTVKEYQPGTTTEKRTFTIQKPSTIHNAMAFGHDASVTNELVTDTKDATKINTFSSAGSIAIGTSASVKGSQNSVALGLNSKVVRTDTETKSTAAFTGDQNNDPGNGVLSIGTIRKTSDGDGVTRRIVGVAGGQDDYDAVNVKQLKAAVKYYKTNATDTANRTVNGLTDVSANYNGEGATGTASVTLGSYTRASGNYSTAIGRDVITSGSTAVGVGTNVSAFGDSSVVLGNEAIAGYTKIDNSKTVPVGATEGVAIGKAAKAESSYTVAIGGNAQVVRDTTVATDIKDAESSIAIGASAKVTGAKYSVALGLNSKVTYNDTKSKTTGAFLTEENDDPQRGVVSIGDSAGLKRRLINVAGGANDYDAVNVKQLKAVVKYYKTNATDTANRIVNGVADVSANYNGEGATGTASVTLGSYTRASGNYSTAIGRDVITSGNTAVGVGTNVTASGVGSVGMGFEANATADNAVAIGRSITTSGSNSFGAGSNVTVSNNYAVGLGYQATASGANAIAIGSSGQSGTNVQATASDAIAIGTRAKGTASAAVAVGRFADAQGENAVALGNNTVATTKNSIAIGESANVEAGQGSIALGWNTQVTADDVKYHPTTAGKTKASPYLLNDEVDKMKDADNGVVAIGRKRTSNDGSSLARRIVGVAGGYNDYDAVNVKQLKAAAWGLQVQNGTGTATDVTPVGTGDLRKITLKAGNNVTLDNTNGVVTINASGGLNSITSDDTNVLGVSTTNGAVTLTPKLATSISATGDGNKLVTASVVNTAINNIPVTTFKADAGGTAANTEGTFTPTASKKEINITGAGKNGTEKQTWTQGSKRFYSDNIGTHLNSDGRVLVGLNDELSVKNITTYKYDGDGKRTTNAGASLTTDGLAGNGTDALTISNGDYAKITVNKGTSATAKGSIDVNGSKITGLAEGTIGAGSTDAVTGGQLHSKLAEKANVSDLTAKANVADLEGKLDKTAELHVRKGDYTVGTNGEVSLIQEDAAGTEKTDKAFKIKNIATKSSVDTLTGNVNTNTTNIANLTTTVGKAITFKGNDGQGVAKKLGEELSITGEGTVSTGTSTAANNIKTTKLTDGSGLQIGLADALTNMKSITGKDGFTISSGGTGTGTDIATMTFNPKKTTGGTTTETNISVNNVKLTGLKDAALNTTSTDAVTGKQLDATNTNVTNLTNTVNQNTTNITNLTNTVNQNAKLGYKAGNEATSKTVAVATGLTFKAGTGTTGTNTTGTDVESTKTGIEITTGNNGVVNIGLNAATRTAIDKVSTLETAIGKTGADGRDGKPGTGADAGMGKDGLTKEDGLNGKDLTTKVNALRNGEAGTVVYTDDNGNRVVKATDGKWYPADKVKADGTKADDAVAVTAVQARLVNPDGSTTTAEGATGTKLSNIANGTIAANSHDAVTGGQLYTAKQELATALGGNATVGTDGTLTQPTYSITKDDATGGTDTVRNVGAAVEKLDARINTVKGMATQPLTFKGDDNQGVARKLDTTLTVKGAANFTPSATNPVTGKGINIRVEKDLTTGANGLVVKLADTLTEMKGITGNGTDPLTIKNGDATITVTPSKPKDGANPAVPSTVDLGGAKLSNIGEAKDNSDAANKAYVDNAVGGITLGYKAETENAKSVAVTTGLTFKAGTGTIAPTNLAPTAESPTKATDSVTTKKGIVISTENDGVVNIGLDEATRKVIDQAAKIGNTAVDGRDGKPGTGKPANDAGATAGDKGLTGKDGLNGTDLTTKVNALRNGEAGTVVYTDDQGNRVVKANDGKWYDARVVDEKGALKADSEIPTGVSKAIVTTPQARLVNPTGSTTTATKLSNIADGTIAAGSHDAVNGGQLHDELAKKADKSVVDNLTTKVNTNTTDISTLKTNVDKAITFSADTGTAATRKLGSTLAVKGGTNFTPVTTGTDITPEGTNIQVQSDATNGLSVHLADTLTGMKGISGNGTDPLTIKNGDTTITVTPSQPQDGTNPAVPSTVNFGGAKLTNVAKATDNGDVTNKEYVDEAISKVNKAVSGNATLNFAGNVTKDAANADTDKVGLALSTGVLKVKGDTTANDIVTTAKGDTITIGLSQATKDTLAKVSTLETTIGKNGADGRDGKPGTGTGAGMGKDGVTGKDGLNGTNLTTKVNALRNGEAGAVVYTDDKGNRLVRATDGKWYPSDKVKADGTVKSIGEDGITTAPVGLEADKVIASLVSPDGTTVPKATDTAKKAMTKLSNIAEGAITATSNDAVTGRQLHAAETKIAEALGGGATVGTDGTITKPTYTITTDGATAGTETADNVGTAITKLDTRINTLKGNPLTFSADTGTAATRKLGETLAVKGGGNFAPVTTGTGITPKGTNIQVKSNATDGLSVHLADTLTDMKGISGTGTNDLVIKNGDYTTITVKPGTPAPSGGTATPGTVDFGGSKLTNVGEATGNDDVTNKKYVDDKVAGLNLGYKAESETAKSVAVTTGLTFKAGTGTIAPTNLAPTAESSTKDTDSVTTKKGIVISTENDGVVNIGLDEATRKVIDQAAKIGNTAVDGRDGKPGTGATAGMGKDGVTGKDGLNGTDLTTKVNALRNGEAGTVVYTDDKGNRLVRATDGKWYPADKVKADGTVKAVGEDGITTAPVGLEADKVIASLVSPDGTTVPKATDTAKKAMTKLTNIAEGTISDKSNDAVTGRQLYDAKKEIGDIIGGTTIDGNGKITGPTFSIANTAGGSDTATTVKDAIEKLNTTNVNQNTKISTLETNVGKAISFVGDNATNDKIDRHLGETLNIKGQNNISVTKATGSKDTLNVSLASDLKNITSITNADADNKPATKIQLGADGVTITNTQAPATGSTTGVTKTVTIGKDGINAGSMKITNVAEATQDGDAANKKYVDDAISGLNTKVTNNANLRYAGDTNVGAATGEDHLNLALATGTLKVAGTADQIKTEANNGIITVSLHETVTNQLNKLGNTAADGRDGKPGIASGSTAAGIGAQGPTGKDGLNGKTVTEKVNALRNGEAGTVVYTDDQGNRVVRASDGKFYNANEVKADGAVKTKDENGGKEPTEVTTIQARLVNPDGTTVPKAGAANGAATTKMSNIAEGAITATSNDAVTGRQLHAAKTELATALGGGAAVNTNGTLKAPTYKITNDANATTPHSVNNVGEAVTKLDERITAARAYTDTSVGTAKTELTNSGMDFKGDDGNKVHRNLKEELTIKGDVNFTPTATTPTTAAGVNIRVEKDLTINANGLVVKLADTLTNMKGISGTGTNDFVIKNGDNAVITVKAPTGTDTKGTVDFGGTKLTNLGEGTIGAGSTDAVTGGQVHTKLAEKANKDLDNLTTTGENKVKALAQGAVRVAAGKNAMVTADDSTANATTYVVDANDTTVRAASSEIVVDGGTLNANRVREYTVGLSQDVKDKLNNLGKIGNTVADGRDGKTANGSGTTAGDHGLTGKDGLNGKDLTTKVNALRNGEAGTVVYTDADGNRLVKTNDGKWYPATAVGDNGELKPVAPGATAPVEVKAKDVVASLVSPDGTTTNATTVLNNVGSALASIQKDNATTAEDTNYLDKLAKATDNTSKVANSVVNVTDLKKTADAIIGKGLTFKGNDGTDIPKALGSTLSIVGEGNYGTPATAPTTAAKNIFTKHVTENNDTRLEIGLAKDLVGITSIANETDATKAITKVDIGNDGITVTNTQPVPAGAAPGTQPVVTKTTIGKEGVKVGDTVTLDKAGISGNGTDSLTITNGANTKITVNPSTATDAKGTVDFGGARITNIAAPTGGTDAVNKAYVDDKIGNVAEIGYKANAETSTNKVAVGTGLHFKSGAGTIKPTNLAAGATSPTNATDNIITKTGIAISTEAGGIVNIGLDEATRKVIDKAAQLGDTAVDGRDGKPGTGADAGMGKDGLTGADGMNGKDLTSKVNALRNGEAGSVVYTDADGNRLVKADDGKFYKANDVDANGKVKAPATGGDAPVGLTADKVIASLVSPDGTTAPNATDANKKAMTKLSNIAEGAITSTSNDAVTGRQLHAAKTELATVLGGGATVANDGTWTAPTYTITNDANTTTPHSVDNVGAAVTKLDERITAARTYTDTKVGAANTALTTAGMNFKGDDTTSVHRDLGTELTIKGGQNFDPTAMTTKADAGVNIRVEKDNTAGANGLTVKLADTLTNMKGISGNGTDDLVIKNGTNKITITAGKAATATTPADPGTVNFGDAKVTVKNLDASITYRANGATDADAKTVKLKQGLDFVAGTGTIGNATTGTDAETTKKGIAITTGENGKVYFGLDADTRKTIDNAAKIGNTASDGRDGKTADGTGVAGDKGLTGKDGLNGKDMTNKVNALRNGEAGSVVYTDADGNRLVKANDGKYYKANEVKDDGTVKTATELGVADAPKPVDNPQARLVNPDGTTTPNATDANKKAMTKLSNIAEGAITSTSNDAVTGRQIYDERINAGLIYIGQDGKQLFKQADGTFKQLDGTNYTGAANTVYMKVNGTDPMLVTNVKSAVAGISNSATVKDYVDKLDAAVTNADKDRNATTAVNVSDLKETAHAIIDKGLTFQGNDGTAISKTLGSTLEIVGEGAAAITTAADNIRTKANNGKLEIGLVKDLKHIDSITAGSPTAGLILSNGGNPAATTGATGKNTVAITDGATTFTNVQPADPAVTDSKSTTSTVIFDKNGTAKFEHTTDGTTDNKVTIDSKTGTITAGKETDKQVVINGTDGTIKTGKTTVDGTSVSVKDGDKTSTMNADGVTVENGDDKTKVGSKGVSISDGTNAAVHSATESKFVADGKEASYSANGVHVTDGANKSVDITSDGTTIANGTVTTTTKAGESEYVNGNKVTTVNTAGMNVTDGTNTANYTASGITLSPSASGTGTVSLTTAGLNNGGNKITNVADATSDGDVVNLKQLKAGKTAFTVNDNNGATTNHNLVLTTTKDATDGHTNYDVKLADKVTLGKDDKAVTVDGTNGSITAGKDGNAVTVDGTKASITAGKDDNAVTVDGTKASITAGKDDKAVTVDGTKASITAGKDDKAVTVDGTKASITAGKDDKAVTVDGTKAKIAAGTGTNAVTTDGTKALFTVGGDETTANTNKVTVNGANATITAGTNNATKVTVDGAQGKITTGKTEVTTDGITVKDGNNTGSINAMNSTFTNATNGTQVGPTLIRVNGENKNNAIEGGIAIGYHADVVTSVATATKETGNFITGLVNTTWNPKTNGIVSGRAATEDQLKAVDDKVNKGRVFTADTKVGDKPLEAMVGLGDTLSIKGGADMTALTDNNIGVELKDAETKDGKVVTPATMTVKLAKDVKMGDGSTSYVSNLPEYERDEHGNVIYYKDKFGTVLPKEKVDATGHTIYRTGKDNTPITLRTTKVDGNSTTHILYKTENGNIVVNEDGKPVIDVITGVGANGIAITSNGKPSVTLTSKGLDNGGNTISNIAPGVYESDAVTVGQLNTVSNTVTTKVNEAGAHAAALAAMNPLSYDPLKKSQVMAGVGAYKGNKALALGVAHYANEDTMFNVGVSVGGGSNMMNAGVTYRFGGEDSMIPERYKGGPISSVYILQDEVSALKAENAQVKADNEQVKADNARMKENYEKVMQDNEEMKAQIKMLMAHMGIK